MADLSEAGLDEQRFGEIEKVLLYISDARERAARTATELARTEAPEHLVEAVRQAETSLAESHRALMQGTYFAVDTPESRSAI